MKSYIGKSVHKICGITPDLLGNEPHLRRVQIPDLQRQEFGSGLIFKPKTFDLAVEVDEFTLFKRIELRAFVQGTFHLTPCGTRTVRRGAVTPLDAIHLRHHAFVILGGMFEARAPEELMRQVRENGTLVILLAALGPLDLA